MTSNVGLLLRFHLGAGARLAMRTLAPIPAGLVAVAVLSGSPMAVLSGVGRIFFPPELSLTASAATMMLCLALASWAGPRVTLGVAGWLRHLPASGTAQRRAACAAMAISQGPILIIVAGSGLFIATTDLTAAVVARLIALPVIAWAASLAVMRVGNRPLVSTLALSGAFLAGVGSWWPLLAAAALVTWADAIAGDPVPRRDRAPRTRSLRWVATGPLMSIVISIRALGWRWLPALVWPGLCLLVNSLFARNNQLSPWQAACSARLWGAIAMVLFLGVLSDRLLYRRPPWQWARSLPWSAATRVLLDAALLCTGTLPVLAVAASQEVMALLPLAAVLPYYAMRAASAIRTGNERGGASGQFIVEGFIVAAAIATFPWFAGLFLIMTPLALWHGSNHERWRRAGRWEELHHLSDGDTLSWSGS